MRLWSKRWAALASATVLSVLVGSPTVAAEPRKDTFYMCQACTVRSAGPVADRGTVGVLLHDPAGKFGDTWFLGKQNQDQILATALAAIEFHKEVEVHLADTTMNSEIQRIFLRAKQW